MLCGQAQIFYMPHQGSFSILFHYSHVTYRFLFCLFFLNNILVSFSEEQKCQVLEEDFAVEGGHFIFLKNEKGEEMKSFL